MLRTSSQFSLYVDGSLQFVDSRVVEPVSFAHVADLHLSPDPPSLWPQRYRHAMEWWNTSMNHPSQALPGLLDDIAACGVDFVFFGGDTIEYYHQEPASRIVRLCRDRGLKACFQLGNHDWETEHLRYVTHAFDDKIRLVAGRALCDQWNMPNLYYAFEHKGVRFVSLDTSHYVKTNEGYEARVDDEQTNWFINQLDYDGPIVIFCHVPFNVPTAEYRLRAVWGGVLACMAEDENGRRIRSAVETCPNVLGVFAAHAHIRSEDQLGQTCQFLAPPGHDGLWRQVKIGTSTPPKSLRVSGEPSVENRDI